MDRKMLLDAVKNTATALKSKKAGERYIYLTLKNGLLTASAGCSYIRIWSRCKADMPDFAAAVSSETLISALSRLQAPEVQIHRGSNLQLCSDGVKVQIPCLEKDECQPFMEETSKAFSKIKIQGLGSAVNQCSHALGAKGLNPTMAAFHLEVFDDGTFRLTALDGYRISVRGNMDFEVEPSLDLLVYGEEFSDAVKLLGMEDIDLSISDNENCVVMENSTTRVSINILTGKYFSKKALQGYFGTPSSYVTKVNKDDFVGALNITRLMTNNTLVDIHENGIFLQTVAQAGEAEIKIPCLVTGVTDTVETRFNGDFLHEALNSLPSAVVEVGFSEPGKPCILSGGENAAELVMAMRR